MTNNSKANTKLRLLLCNFEKSVFNSIFINYEDKINYIFINIDDFQNYFTVLNPFDIIIFNIENNDEKTEFALNSLLKSKNRNKTIFTFGNFQNTNFSETLKNKNAIYFELPIHKVLFINYLQNLIENNVLKNEIISNKLEIKTLNHRFNNELKTRQLTENALKENHNSLNITLNSIGDGVIATDLEGKVTMLNPVAEKLTGWKQKDAKGKHFSEVFRIVNANTRATVENPIINVLKYGKKVGLANNTVLISKSGKEYQISDSAAPIFDKERNIKGVVLVFFDISDKYEYQRKIKNLYKIIENSLNEIFIFDANTLKFSFVNNGALKNLGYSLEEMQNMTPLDIAPEFNEKCLRKVLEPLVSGKNSIIKIETSHKRKDGSTYPIEVSLNIHKIFNETIFFAIINDISKRKEFENKIKEKERFQSNLIDNLPGFVYRMHNDKNWSTSYISETCNEITGYSPEDFLSGRPNFNDLILDKYKDLLWKKWQKVIKNNEIFEHEFQIRKSNGDIIWVYERGNAIYNENRNLLFLEGYIEDINNKKLLEIENSKHQKEIFSFFENDITADYISTIEGTLNFCNKTYVKLFGFKSKEEALNYPIEKLYKDISVRKQLIKELKKNKKVENYEITYLTKDKKEIHTLINASLKSSTDNKYQIYGYIFDITSRKKAEEKIRKLNTVVEQSYDAVVITDTSGVIEYVNEKLCNLTNYTYNEIIGKTPKIFHSNYHSKLFYKNLWEQILSGEHWEGEILNKKKNGELYWELTKITPLKDKDGKITHFVAVKEDITEKKKIRQELINAKEKAEESDRLKSAFLANMSHEIRTPMNGILGFAQLLKKNNIDNDKKIKFVEIIEESGNRLLNIINDIIDISKIEAAQVEVNLSNTNLNQQLDFIYNFFKPETDKKNIQFVCKKQLSDECSFCQTDTEKLYAVLTNLVKNAIKFTEKGYIEFGYNIENGNYIFYVKDTGVGVEKEKQKLVFERFRQGSENYNRKYEGSGLGLTISKSYIEMLGGKIWMESEFGQGSSFYFTLPYIAINEENTVNNNHTDYKIQTKLNKKLKVLLCEDDFNSAKLSQEIISEYCSQILLAETGLEAISHYKQNPDIDLIIMDIKMPLMDGMQATRKIRQLNKNVPIFALTAFVLKGDKESVINNGCNEYLSKPLKPSSIIELIEKYFHEN